MTSVLITGCNRGIGLELVKLFLQHETKPAKLIATCRNPDAASDLQKLTKEHDDLHILKLDVADVKSFNKFREEVETIVGPNGLNVLINNAAVNPHTLDLDDLDVEEYTNTFVTNTVAPLFLAKALLPLLRRASQINHKKSMSIQKAAIINISSSLGSVSLNNAHETNRYFAYSESKSALNQSSRSLCRALLKDSIIVSILHPGWVRTDMGGLNADISVDECGAGLIRVIYGLTEEQNGKFLAYNGSEISW